MAMVPLREWRTPTLTVSAALALNASVEARAKAVNNFFRSDRFFIFMRDVISILVSFGLLTGLRFIELLYLHAKCPSDFVSAPTMPPKAFSETKQKQASQKNSGALAIRMVIK